MNFDHNPDYLGYKLGEKASLDFLVVKAIKDRSTIKTRDIEKIKKASKKIFPIKFSDIHPLTKGLGLYYIERPSMDNSSDIAAVHIRVGGSAVFRITSQVSAPLNEIHRCAP